MFILKILEKLRKDQNHKYAIIITLFYVPFEFLISYYCKDSFMESHHYYKVFIAGLLPYSFIYMGRYIGRILLAFYTLYIIALLAIIYKTGSILPNQIKAIIGVSPDILLSIIHMHIMALSAFMIIGIIVFISTRKFCSFKPLRAFWPLCLLIILFSLSWRSSGQRITVANPSLEPILCDIRAYKIFKQWPNTIGILAYGIYEHVFSVDIKKLPHDHIDKMVIGEGPSEVQNIIFVIGETATSDRQNYLHPEETPLNTPNMLRRIQEHNACAIKNAFSTASQTPTAVASMVSFSSADHPEKLITEKNLLDLAHDAGYRIYWLDMQPGNNIYDVPQGYISQYADIMVRPDYRYSNIHSILDEKKFPLDGGDEQLLPILEQLLSKETKPQKRFIILHLHGSHFEYYNKYDALDSKALPKADEYDLTIHHTDRVLEMIINKAEQYFGKNYMVFYSSDHGEDLQKHQHGILRGNLSQYRIPVLLIGSSDNYEMTQKWCLRSQELHNQSGAYQQIMDKVILGEMMGYHFDPQALERMKSTHRIYHVDGKIYNWGFVPNETSAGKPSLRRPELD